MSSKIDSEDAQKIVRIHDPTPKIIANSVTVSIKVHTSEHAKEQKILGLHLVGTNIGT